MSPETTSSSKPNPGSKGPRSGAPGHRPGGYRSGPGGRPGAGGPGKPGGMRRPGGRRRTCRICDEKKGHIDWKAFNYLRGFITDRGKILAGRSKGICSPCQRNLSRAIKRARDMALLPTSPL